jgi:hypothetical protein
MEKNIEILEPQIASIVKNLKSEFWIWACALGAMAVLSFWFGPKVNKLDGDTTISLQSMLLLILLVGFPGVFIWFRNRMQQLLGEVNLVKRMKRYQLFSRLRQFVFFILGLLILVVQVFTALKGGIMLFLIVVVLSMFILPSRTRLLMEAHLLPANDEAAKEDIQSDNN